MNVWSPTWIRVHQRHVRVVASVRALVFQTMSVISGFPYSVMHCGQPAFWILWPSRMWSQRASEREEVTAKWRGSRRESSTNRARNINPAMSTNRAPPPLLVSPLSFYLSVQLPASLTSATRYTHCQKALPTSTLPNLISKGAVWRHTSRTAFSTVFSPRWSSFPI